MIDLWNQIMGKLKVELDMYKTVSLIKLVIYQQGQFALVLYGLILWSCMDIAPCNGRYFLTNPQNWPWH